MPQIDLLDRTDPTSSTMVRRPDVGSGASIATHKRALPARCDLQGCTSVASGRMPEATLDLLALRRRIHRALRDQLAVEPDLVTLAARPLRPDAHVASELPKLPQTAGQLPSRLAVEPPAQALRGAPPPPAPDWRGRHSDCPGAFSASISCPRCGRASSASYSKPFLNMSIGNEPVRMSNVSPLDDTRRHGPAGGLGSAVIPGAKLLSGAYCTRARQ